MPSTSATLATGMLLSAPSVAASTTKAAPATPAAPFEVSEQDQQQADLVPDIERRVGRLRQEHGGGREIKTGAVEIERIAGRHHEPDDAFLAAEPLELVHDARQHRFRRRRGDADQQLFLDVADQLQTG